MIMFREDVTRITGGIFLILLLFSLPGCGNKPLFDEMAESLLQVVIKGTFESNDPRGWTLNSATNAQKYDDSINDVSPQISNPAKLMLDFAEVRLEGVGMNSEDRFANYRQTYTINMNDSDPFFNGRGISFKCDDVKKGKAYGWVKLYIRKMIFDQAEKFYLSESGTWESAGKAEVIFREKDTYGLDFNQLMVNSYYDTLKTNSDDVNRVFPLLIPIDGDFVYQDGDTEAVLEIRLVFKNYIKQYEYDYYDEYSRHAVYQVWGLSDWLRDVKSDERAMGRNIIATARVYKPGKTADITVTTGGEGYVMAIPADSDISEYLISEYDDATDPATLGERRRQ